MFAIRATHAFDGEAFLDGGATVLVDGARIVGVESAAFETPAGCPVADHGHATVLPGLIDVHVHLVGDSSPLALDRVAGYSDEEIDAVVSEALRRHLAAGVTTVRDLGDRRFNVVDRRDAQRAADDHLPWIVAAGPPITIPGGHCHFLGGEVAGAAGITAAVRERAERRVDAVKVMTSGGIATPGTDVAACQFALPELQLLVDEAHRVGLPVVAHAHAAAAMEQCLAVQVDGIEHASYLRSGGLGGFGAMASARADDDELEALARSGIVVCPTVGGLTTDDFSKMPPAFLTSIRAAGSSPEQMVEARMSLIRRMHLAGVRLVSGTDAGIAPSKAHGRYAAAVVELAVAVEAVAALQAATSRAADACGLGSAKGRLRAGYDADVVVVAGDLATELGGLQDVRRVVLRGEPVTLGEVAGAPRSPADVPQG
jgi:imidazolonepropionase-like amidohydrolase